MTATPDRGVRRGRAASGPGRPGRGELAAVFVLALLYFSLRIGATLDLRDEGYLLLRGAEVLGGAVPHRDFADVYGPGVFAFTAAALAVGGEQVLAVRVLVALFQALAVACGYGISRRFASRGLALGVACVAIAWWGRLAPNLNAPYAANFSLPIGLAATLVWVRSRESGSRGGLVAAGTLAGVGILFKQSLGLVLGYGLVLAGVALAWLERASGGDRHSGAGARLPGAAFAALWLAGGLAPMLAMARYLDARSWALHFLPMQAVFVVVALCAWRRGAPRPGRLLAEGLPLAAGLGLAPAATGAVYLLAGGWHGLLDDMFRLPFTLRGYAQPVVPPPPTVAILFACVICAWLAALCGLAARRRLATALAAGAVVGALLAFASAPADRPGLRDPAVLLARGPFALEGLLLPLLLLAALALSWRRLRDPARRAPVLAVWIVSSLACFEVFPRAGHNLWILHGALAPLLALVLAELLRWSGASEGSAGRRRLAVAVALALPVWLVAPLVRTVVWDAAAGDRRPLALSRARGLRLDAVQRAEQQLPHVEALVSWLATAAPSDAPLLVLSNDDGLVFLSGHPALFADHGFALLLAGWGMLPAERRRELDTEGMLARLERAEGLIVITRAGDPTAANRRRALPRLVEHLERSFEVVERFGPYRVLRRRRGLRAGSGGSGR